MAHIFVTTESELKPGFDPEKPSKTMLKAQMDALQTLSGRLIGLSKEKLAQLDLPERLHDEASGAHKITANGAKARQLQFLGKLMRTLDDAHIERIKDKFLAWDGLSKAETTKLHVIEHWRDTLLSSDEALQEFMQAVAKPDFSLAPETLQAMRTAIRQARKDALASKPPKNARVLFQLVKAALEGKQSGAAGPENDDMEDH